MEELSWVEIIDDFSTGIPALGSWPEARSRSRVLQGQSRAGFKQVTNIKITTKAQIPGTCRASLSRLVAFGHGRREDHFLSCNNQRLQVIRWQCGKAPNLRLLCYCHKLKEFLGTSNGVQVEPLPAQGAGDVLDQKQLQHYRTKCSITSETLLWIFCSDLQASPCTIKVIHLVVLKGTTTFLFSVAMS